VKSLLVALLFVVPTIASAEETLSGDQIKQLLVGNTAYGKARKGWEAYRYLVEGGKMVQYQVDSGKIAEGEWSIDGDRLCWGFDRRRVNCGKLVKEGGKYHFLKDGDKRIFTINKIAPGNAEKL